MLLQMPCRDMHASKSASRGPQNVKLTQMSPPYPNVLFRDPCSLNIYLTATKLGQNLPVSALRNEVQNKLLSARRGFKLV